MPYHNLDGITRLKKQLKENPRIPIGFITITQNKKSYLNMYNVLGQRFKIIEQYM